MKIRDLLADPHLQQKKILEKLLCYYTGISKEDIFTSYEKELTKDEYNAIIAGYTAYTKDKKPLEFILGFVEFFQRKFKVDTRCLIPRPETEYMIQAVNEHIQKNCPTNQDGLLIRSMDGQPSQRLVEGETTLGGDEIPLGENIADGQNKSCGETIPKEKNILIDVGTGCGVLGLSVLLENPGYFADAFLTEYYPETLQLASENVAFYEQDTLENNLQPRPKLIQSNLVAFMGGEAYKGFFADANVILIANLPYIPDETFDTQTEDNVRKREPRPAFVGGHDGLDFYREMFQQIFIDRYGESSPDNEDRVDADRSTQAINTSDKNDLQKNKTNETISDKSNNKIRRHATNFTMFLEMMTRQVDILRKEFSDRIDFEEIKTFHFNIRIVKAILRK